jgi:wyosine [tRNA(Phe)-imidazoG37] synthetase (radical SAM superfamily)
MRVGGEKMSTYVYGPVPSRRLGRSLGIDLVPLKTCTYDCLYCQLGKTTHKTTKRQEWVPLEEVLAELKTHLPSEPEYITISGSGEPTLHSGLGSLIKAIKAMTTIPVAVLTNSSLLWLPEVREALCGADLVIPSLDAGEEHLFLQVNRPHRDITFHRMIDGLYEFRRSFAGQCWLEVLLLGGITGLPHPVEQIKEIAGWISPDRVHLNTVFRPPAEFSAVPVPRDLMDCFAAAFGDKAEVIGGGRNLLHGRSSKSTPKELLALVSRRPCTLEDLTAGLGMAPDEAARCVKELSSAGLLAGEHQGGRLYFKATRGHRR